MDQLRYQNIAASLTHSIKSHHNLVKLTQLLLSLSLCSFIFSPSSLFIFLHYFKFYFSTFPFQLFTHNIDKNSMFLLCNGLLVFVGITRSFSGPSGDDDDDENSKNVQHDVTSKYVVEVDSQSQFLDGEGNEPLLEKTIELDEENIAAEEALQIKYCVEEVEEKVEKIIFVGDKEQEKESDQIILEVKEPEDEEEKEVLEEKESEIDYFMMEENIEEDGDEIEEENCISTEELNKKFDDFIRRMKEDLRIEAKQQLFVMV